jgi:hypothetical protein
VLKKRRRETLQLILGEGEKDLLYRPMENVKRAAAEDFTFTFWADHIKLFLGRVKQALDANRNG